MSMNLDKCEKKEDSKPRTKLNHALIAFYLFQWIKEHIIFIWNESKPEFHNKLINCYRERVQVLMREYLDSLPEGLYYCINREL